MPRRINLGFLFIGLTCVQLCHAQTVCSEENREDDLEACLAVIRDGFADPDLPWYGTRYTDE